MTGSGVTLVVPEDVEEEEGMGWQEEGMGREEEEGIG